MNVVVIGGGTGSFMVLSGLKDYCGHITALVSMADDGGSTGQLRDELGVLPPGDARQCLVALSNSPKLRDLFNYRFDESSLAGHSFGNLFITALEKTTGSFADAVETASDVLDIGTHSVLPITLDKVTLAVDDGEKKIYHEREIREATFANTRPRIWLEPKPEPNSAALRAIADADLIVVAPGGLYESLGASLIVRGIGQALAQSQAKKIYVCNLMNQERHTKDFTVADFADELERIAGVDFLDEVIYNTNEPSEELVKRYALEGEHPVKFEEVERHYEFRGVDLLSRTIWKNKTKIDPLEKQRALIRHDSDKLAKCILGSYEKTAEKIKEVKTLYVVDMDRTLIRTSMLFECLCKASNKYQDHLGDELQRDYGDYLIARDTEFSELDLNSENEYVKMRLAGKHATFDPTTALNRILAKRLSSATAHDVYNSMAMQLAENDKYQDYLLPGAEDLLRYINEREDAEMVVLTYGEHAFQDAKFTSVVLPLFRKLNISPRFIATPDRKKRSFFTECQAHDGGFEISGFYGFENIYAHEAIQIGDERDDIIDFEDVSNYRAYCVKSPLDHSNRAWPTEEELAENHCSLFENLQQVIDAEKHLQ